MITRDLDTDVRAWDKMRADYPMVQMYQSAWDGTFVPAEAEIFWMFGAGIEFKVWCARKFLAEFKYALRGLNR